MLQGMHRLLQNTKWQTGERLQKENTQTEGQQKKNKKHQSI
jgi:hypothetical protein